MPVAIFAALVFVSLFLILWIAQERIVFQPPANFSSAGADTARQVQYRALDDQPLTAFLVEPAGPPAGLLICFHGNADLAIWQLDWAAEVARRTSHVVFLAEYRGYFALGGKPTYRGSRLDADAAYHAALGVAGIPAGSVSVFGHSLGSAVAVELAGRLSCRRILLQSPFTSARAMGRLVIGRPLQLVWSRMSRVHFDSERAVRSLSAAVSVVHGARDRIVPVRMGRAVFAAAGRKGQALIIPEAGHNDIPQAGGEDYWDWIVAALD